MTHPEALNDTPGTARTRSTSGPKPHHPRGLTPTEKERHAEELEHYGALVCEDAFGFKSVRIYGLGYVKVATMMMGGSASYERLISIEFSGDVQKKSGVGRAGAAVLTGGANLLLTPNKRGDVYLTIATDKTTHMLRVDPPTAMAIRQGKRLAAAGQAVLTELHQGESRSKESLSEQQGSVSERLKELMKLHEQGMVSDAEFQELRLDLLKDL